MNQGPSQSIQQQQSSPILEEPQHVHQEAALLEAFTTIPSISKAWTCPAPPPPPQQQQQQQQHSSSTMPSSIRLTLQISQRDLPNNSQRKSVLSVPVNESVLETGFTHASMSPPTQLCSDILLYSPSPSGRRTLIIKKPSSSTNSSRTGTVTSSSVIIEVWNGISLEKELVVPDSLHGTVLNDGWWATGASWNHDESSVTYVAEVPVAVRTPEWGNSSDSGENTTTPTSDSKNKAKVQTWRGVGPWQPDWGELNTGRRRSTLFVLDCSTWDVVPALDDVAIKVEGEASYGQPVWTPDGKGIVYVSWPHQHDNFPGFPQPLGIVYCFNRPCGLRLIEWKEGGGGGGKGGAIVLTPHMKSAFSPRFSPDGHTLVFLSQQTAVDTGVHSATSSLHTLSWPHSSSSLSTIAVIDVIYDPTTTVDDDMLASSTGEQSSPSSSPSFPGLYCTMLPDRPFFNDTTLVLTTQWRSTTAILAVDVVNKRYHRVSPTNNDDECSINESWSVVAVDRGWVIAAKSTPSHPWSLWAAHIFPPPTSSASSASRNDNDSTMNFNCWSALGGLSYVSCLSSSSCVVVQEALSKLKTKVLHLQDSMDSDKNKQQLPFEAILIYSSNDTAKTAADDNNKPSSMPAILTPHGGPHTAFSTSYIMSISYLASLGYAVIAVNYRGSTGFGEAGIQSLPGRIGTADVADCMTALDTAMTYLNTANDSSTNTLKIDKERVHVIGGSHGGFLTAHLVGQHPDNFKTGILRNPVCDLTAMIHMTDIPDWCFVEAGVPMDRAKTKPGSNDLAQLAKVSPSQYVEEVKAPLLFLLGAKDRRVPMDDGKRYAEALKNALLKDKKKRGNSSSSSDVVGDGLRVVVFPEDTHALDRPRTEFEQWITAVWWMKKHS
jgi:acylaminoacyl-peptidase